MEMVIYALWRKRRAQMDVQGEGLFRIRNFSAFWFAYFIHVCNVLWSIHSQSLPFDFPYPFPTLSPPEIMWLLSFLHPLKFTSSYLHALGSRTTFWDMGSLQEPHPWRKLIPSSLNSYQLPVTPQLGWLALDDAFPHPHRDFFFFWLPWSCEALVHPDIAPVSSHVYSLTCQANTVLL